VVAVDCWLQGQAVVLVGKTAERHKLVWWFWLHWLQHLQEAAICTPYGKSSK